MSLEDDLTERDRGGSQPDRQGTSRRTLRSDRALSVESQLGCLFSLPSRPVSSSLWSPIPRLSVCWLRWSPVHLIPSVFAALLPSLAFLLLRIPSCHPLLLADTKHNTAKAQWSGYPREMDPHKIRRRPTSGDDSIARACMQPTHYHQTHLLIKTRRRPSAGFLQAGAGAWRPGVAVANQTCGPEHVQDRGREGLLATWQSKGSKHMGRDGWDGEHSRKCC